MNMDKLIIKYEGDATDILKEPEERLAVYLLDREIEVTYIHNMVEDNVNTILFYGYEAVDGLIDKILDKRRKNNIYQFL